MNDNPIAGLWADAEPDEQQPGVEPTISVEDIDGMLARIKGRMVREPEMAKAMFESMNVLIAAETAEHVPMTPKMRIKMGIDWPETVTGAFAGIHPGMSLSAGPVGRSTPLASEYIDKAIAAGSVVMAKRAAMIQPRFVLDMEADFDAAAAIDRLTAMAQPKSRPQGKSRVMRQIAEDMGIKTIEIDSIVFDETHVPTTMWMHNVHPKHCYTNEDKAKHKAKSRGENKHPGKGWKKP